MFSEMAVELYMCLPNGVLALVFFSENCVISLLSQLVLLGVCVCVCVSC